MKKFLKRSNRGLLLGALLLIALIIYIAADYIRFSADKSTIKDTITDYMTDYFDLAAKGDYSKLKDFVNNNWSEERISNMNYFLSVDDFNSVLSKSDFKKGAPSDIDFSIRKLSVQKAGPGMAIVNLEYTASVSCKSDIPIILPFGNNIQADYDNEAVNCKFQISGMNYVYVKKENGSWKITEADSYENISSYEELEAE